MDDAHGGSWTSCASTPLSSARSRSRAAQTAQYYVDAKRAILLPAGFTRAGRARGAEAERVGATAVGGMTMGADPVACSALAAGADVKAFFVRKDKKQHGLQRWVEGPLLDPGERCLIVEDVVTTGGSTVKAIERVREEGFEIVGVVSVLDRLAGGGEAIEAAATARRIGRSPRSTTCIRTGPDRRPAASQASISRRAIE